MLIPTCIIGAHYGDGVVIATDKRVVIGSKITDEAKMFLIHRGQIAIAFAGEKQELPGMLNVILKRI